MGISYKGIRNFFKIEPFLLFSQKTKPHLFIRKVGFSHSSFVICLWLAWLSTGMTCEYHDPLTRIKSITGPNPPPSAPPREIPFLFSGSFGKARETRVEKSLRVPVRQPISPLRGDCVVTRHPGQVPRSGTRAGIQN